MVSSFFSIIVLSLAWFVAVEVVPGVAITDTTQVILAGIVLAILNAFVRPLLVFLTLPITILTLGLFLRVINVSLVMMTAWLLPGLTIATWFAALLTSLILTVVTLLFRTKR